MDLNPYEASDQLPAVAANESRDALSFALGATGGVTLYWLFNSGLPMTLQTYRDAPFLGLVLHLGTFVVALLAAVFVYCRSNQRLRRWQRFALRFLGGLAFVISGLKIQSLVGQSVEQMLTPGPLTLVIRLSFGVIGGLLLSVLLERVVGAFFVADWTIGEPDDARESPS